MPGGDYGLILTRGPYRFGGDMRLESDAQGQHTLDADLRPHSKRAAPNSFDLARRADGNPVFQGPWDPDHGRVVLRLARPAFPEIRTWTEDIVDARYDPRTKLLTAIYGAAATRPVALTPKSPGPVSGPRRASSAFK